MHENGNPSQTTFQDLTIHDHYEILKRMDKDDLKNAKKVCLLWYSIIDEWIGWDVTTSSLLIVHPNNPHVMKTGLELISEIGVRSFLVDWGWEESPKELSAPFPTFKRPHLLKIFKMNSPLHSDLLKSLFKHTANLSSFDILIHVLTTLSSDDLELLTKNFPKLACLKVRLNRNEEMVPSGCESNLRTLLKKDNFPCLSRLEINYPVTEFADFESTRNVIRFIQAHRGLVRLSLIMTFSNGRHDNRTWGGPEQTDYKEDLEKILNEIRGADVFLPSLKVLNLDGWDSWAKYPHLEIMKELLIKPSSLVEVAVRLGPIPNAIWKGLCCRNESTLKKLTNPLQNGFQERPSLDLTVFAGMRRLQYLRMWGNGEISGATHLPHTLEALKLEGAMRSEDMEHIMLRLPNLRTINLRNPDGIIGEETDGLGTTLRQFVKNGKVFELRLNWARDQNRFKEEDIPNGDPLNPLMLPLQKNYPIWWKQNADGYYFSVI